MPSSFKAELIEKTQIAKDVFFFNFRLIDPQSINFEAGQYVFFKINDVTRLYSIASSKKTKNQIELIIKIHPQRGIASNYFFNLNVGQIVNIYGPAGFFKLNSNQKKKKLIAFGTGVVPFRSILKSYNDSLVNCDIKLFWGLKTVQDAYILEDLKELKNNISGFEYNICLSQETDFIKLDNQIYKSGRVNNYILGNDCNNCEYYLCGQQEVVMATNLFLQGSGVKRENIFFEIY
jgi:NAD(P)H-flavin reductase